MLRTIRITRHYSRLVAIFLCSWLNAYVGAIAQPVSTPAPSVPALSLVAGDIRGAGAVDAAGASARFNRPSGITVDAAGNVYVADYNNRTIRKITPAGEVTTLAGTAGVAGANDGSGAAAQFGGPIGITADAAGNLYVADANNSIIRKITPAGAVNTLAGTPTVLGSADGSGAAAQFRGPFGVTVDAVGNLYVTDTFNATIRKITPAGAVSTLAGTAGMTGSADGTGAAARFGIPQGIVADAAGNLYVADTLNHNIRKITPAGVVSTLAGTAGTPGSADGAGAAARFNNPSGITIDAAGNLYVADTANNTIRKITPAGVVTTLAGMAEHVGSADGAGAAARFRSPADVTADAAGNLYVADLSNHTIRKITSSGVVSTLAGPPQTSGSADGVGDAARFNGPAHIAAAGGNLYVADAFNNTIRKITPALQVTTLAGAADAPGSTDGIGAAARFNRPLGIAADAAGNVYVADTRNHTIRKIAPSGAVTTLAGTAGMAGGVDGNGAAARFNNPAGITIDVAGNVYVADTLNHTIRKITPSGAVTTLAGAAGMAGGADGTGAQARFDSPQAVELDAAGNLYVAEARAIRKITQAGVVTTLAGNLESAGSGDGVGTAASFDLPVSIAIDQAGNLYVIDFNNHTLRLVTPAGAVTTLAGITGEDSGTIAGSLGTPVGIAFIDGNLLAVTTGNAVIALNLLFYKKSG